MRKKYILGTLTFILVTFLVQSMSHFVVNVEHYASVPYMREEVIFPLGFLTMTLQGLILTFLFGRYAVREFTWKSGIYFGLLISGLFVSYMTFTEPAKYQVPDIGAWMMVEASAGLIQFCAYGVLLSFMYKRLK